MRMKNLAEVSEREQKEFFNSFDHILCDVDGVLLLVSTPIEGSAEAIESLQNLGKKITIVSNNCSRTVEMYSKELKKFGFNIDPENIVIPILAIVDYFKRLPSFDKEIFVVAVDTIKQELEKAGFKTFKYKPEYVIESYTGLQNALKDDERIGAIVIDVDINLNFIKLQKAAVYLNRPEVHFITGGSDTKIPFGPSNTTLIGPGFFRNILEEVTGRKATFFGKPSKNLNEFLKKHCTIGDPSRVLFIGDTVTEDMAFAHNSGYKKLLVLSGVTKNVDNWIFPQAFKPDYYVDSLKTVHAILSNLYSVVRL